MKKQAEYPIQIIAQNKITGRMTIIADIEILDKLNILVEYKEDRVDFSK